jgi:hypothetical protein
MKVMLLFVCSVIIVLTLSHTKVEPAMVNQRTFVLQDPDTLSFKKTIQPILQKNCTPCHFPGGKMYAAMPFDRSETIIGHKEGALKRFSDKAENLLIKQFIDQYKHD